MPDFFARLLLPDEFMPDFAFDVTWDDFKDYMAGRDKPLEVEPKGSFLFVQVVPMGWTWALFFA